MALIVFFASLFNIRYRAKQQLLIFSACLAALYLWLGFSAEEVLWRNSDLVSDCVGCVIALGMVAYAWRKSHREKMSAKKTPNSQQNLQGSLQGSGIVIRNLLLIVGLLAHLYFNLKGLGETQSEPFKDMLDIKNFVLSYVMVIAALTEVGSTSKAIFRMMHTIATWILNPIEETLQ